MPYYAVSAPRLRHKSYVSFAVALVENWSELAMLCQMWPQLVTPITGYFLWLWTISGHFRASWYFDLNMLKPDRKCKNCTKKGIQWQTWPQYNISRHFNNYWTIISHFRSNLSNHVSESLHSVTLYTKSRSLNSDLKCTNSFKLDVHYHFWPPLPTTGHTGPVDAINMQYMPLAGDIRHPKPFRAHLSKIDQNWIYCVKCGPNWWYLSITGHIVWLWTIAGHFRAYLEPCP